MRVLPAAAFLAALLLAAGPLRAAEIDAGTQQQLLGVFDAYRQAISAGKFDAAMALMSNVVRTQAKAKTRTEKDRREALATARMMLPDNVSVVHSFIDKTGTRARLVTLATKAVPKGGKPAPGAPPPGTIMRGGFTLVFVKEGGAWKFDEQSFGPDPTVALACKSETADPPSAYDSDSKVSAGGPVVRVEFKPDYTVVVFSVVGEANCAFLPNREVLVKHGLNPDNLVPYAIVSVEGERHKTDPQKILVDKLDVAPEQ